jgi:hypothetical protein
MPLIISRTYEETTPESVEDGDFSDSGFVYKDTEFSFRDLVTELRRGGFSEMSSWPCHGDPRDWASQYHETTCYRTGTTRAESLHFSRSNPPQKGKYWAKALRAAGLIK